MNKFNYLFLIGLLTALSCPFFADEPVLKIWQNNVATAYALDEVDSITFDNVVAPEQPAAFSVSRNKTVTFATGNLRYVISDSAWLFAENQYDIVGVRNMVESQFADTIDLFAWSTNANPMSAWGVTLLDNDSLFNGDFVDWGKNFGDGNTWRTLTASEWEYLRASRKNAANLIGVGAVNGMNGLIILPDNWECPEGLTFKKGFSSEEYSYTAFAEHQSYTADEGEVMEKAGAVFLPCAGFRMGTSLAYMQLGGLYWTSSVSTYGTRFASYFLLMSDGAGVGNDMRSGGNAVRLVRDL